MYSERIPFINIYFCIKYWYLFTLFLIFLLKSITTKTFLTGIQQCHNECSSKDKNVTKINGTVSIISGGSPFSYTYSAKTWYYNHETESFTNGPNLLERRRYHGSATIVDKVSKAKIPIVTGGSSVHDYLKSTELLIDGQWQTGTIHCENFIT